MKTTILSAIISLKNVRSKISVVAAATIFLISSLASSAWAGYDFNIPKPATGDPVGIFRQVCRGVTGRESNETIICVQPHLECGFLNPLYIFNRPKTGIFRTDLDIRSVPAPASVSFRRVRRG